MVDVHEPRDYPVVLGESLKNAGAESKYLQFRYNWVPNSGFHGASGVLKKPTEDFSLSYELDGDDYNYNGWENQNGHRDETSDFVLIYNQAGKNFRLERLAASIDLNLKSASNAFASDIRKHQQIPKQSLPEASSERNDQQKDSDRDNGEADASNPFDYRHFLVEAQQELDKSSHPTENKTPLPGAGTPLSGFTSPAPGATQFRAATPEFKSVDTVPQKRKAPVSKRKAGPTPRRQAPQKAAPARGKVLSKDRITDSDEDIDLDDDPAPRREVPPASSKPKKAPVQSPEIQIDNASDAESDGGLEIDNGSPPPTSKAKRHINVEAFRSGTSTPLVGHSTSRNRGKSHLDDVEMMDADEDDDQDVEPLVLERDSPAAQISRHARRSLSPPIRARQSTVDEDDVDLEAEFEKELEAEDEDTGIGLGIDHGHGGGREDESEISEEE